MAAYFLPWLFSSEVHGYIRCVGDLLRQEDAAAEMGMEERRSFSGHVSLGKVG